MQEENQTHLFTDLGFDHTARQHILSIASWAMTIVVVTVIGYVLNIVQLLSGTKTAVTKSEGFDLGVTLSGGNAPSSVIGILIGLLINYFLYRFASLSRSGITGLNQNDLNKSFNNLKIYFTILSVILVFVFVIVFLATVVVAMRAV